MLRHRFTVYFVPHFDPTLGKVGDAFPPLDCFGKWLSDLPAGETRINWGWALSPLQPH